MIVIMGLPGVGKSTVLKELIKINKKIAVLNYGDIVFSLAKMKFNVSNRDQINLMPVENHKMIQKEAIKEIKSANSKESKLGKLLILDTHAAIKKPTSYLPGLTYDLLSSVPIEAFIFIDAPTHEIIERRENDLKRKRIPLNADDINNLREVSLSFINVYAAATGKPYYVVINRKGKMKETVDEINRIINSTFTL